MQSEMPATGWGACQGWGAGAARLHVLRSASLAALLFKVLRGSLAPFFDEFWLI
jgi:hypothetical protein